MLVAPAEKPDPRKRIESFGSIVSIGKLHLPNMQWMLNLPPLGMRVDFEAGRPIEGDQPELFGCRLIGSFICSRAQNRTFR